MKQKQLTDPPIASVLVPFWRDVRRFSLCTIATVIMLLWVFQPYGLWPLAFLALAPWTYAVCSTQRAWLIHWISFLGGWFFYLIAVRWLMPVTGLGYAALGFYLAIYWPMAAWAIRAGLRHGISPIWTLPFVWVATEYLRGWVMSGFPWFFVGHALNDQTILIQIADIFGVYGVSFVAIFVSGALAEFFVQRRRRPLQPPRRQQLWAGGGVAILLVGSTLVYGRIRAGQYQPTPGPRVAVLQAFYPLTSTPPYGRAPSQKVFADYLSLAAAALRESPDLIAFPETAWSSVLNKQFLQVDRHAVDGISPATWFLGSLYDEALRALARADFPTANRALRRLERSMPEAAEYALEPLANVETKPASLLVGTMAVEFTDKVYPSMERFNSAVVYDPHTGQRDARYDKIHLVPFGELVPFRQQRFLGMNLHNLYKLLNKLSPFSDRGRVEYTLTAGERFQTFELQADSRIYRFGVPICYEDTTAYVPRLFTWGEGKKRLDFLVNISNDGWFHMPPPSRPPSTIVGKFLWDWWAMELELPQHLAICQFRAVENRVPIARAVNTGISAIIDANGVVREAVSKDGKRFGNEPSGYLVAEMPLDARKSYYGIFGDWFARVCLVTGVAFWVEAIVARWLLNIRRWFRGKQQRGLS
ncbi:MAG: apolipoprotein N-acyltransferase [Phycisphaerae bacterium]